MTTNNREDRAARDLAYADGFRQGKQSRAAATAAPQQSDDASPYHHMAQRETQLAEKFITAVKGEQLHEDLDNPEDAGYRNAINDALRAIRCVCAEEGIEVPKL